MASFEDVLAKVKLPSSEVSFLRSRLDGTKIKQLLDKPTRTALDGLLDDALFSMIGGPAPTKLAEIREALVSAMEECKVIGAEKGEGENKQAKSEQDEPMNDIDGQSLTEDEDESKKKRMLGEGDMAEEIDEKIRHERCESA